MSSRLGKWLTDAMHQEPVVMWSLGIGAVGLLFPVILPPIRETFETKPTKPLQPIKVRGRASSAPSVARCPVFTTAPLARPVAALTRCSSNFLQLSFVPPHTTTTTTTKRNIYKGRSGAFGKVRPRFGKVRAEHALRLLHAPSIIFSLLFFSAFAFSFLLVSLFPRGSLFGSSPPFCS